MRATTSVTLLQKVRRSADHPGAWDRFTELYVPLLYRQARGLGLQPDDAADLVQDVLVILVRSMPEFQYLPGLSFRGWLKTVVRNCWKSRLRKRRVSQADDVQLSSCAIADPLDRHWDEEYARHMVHVTLPRLRPLFPPAEWMAFQRYVLQGQPAAQVATDLGVTTATVYAARSKVLRKLRDELGDLLREP